ncbi:MFS transporter [Alistipes sp. OttesenSCG-928-B03]|nr:MFS transporter [Alistipes sp. OttesenSCG-928-B03]
MAKNNTQPAANGAVGTPLNAPANPTVNAPANPTSPNRALAVLSLASFLVPFMGSAINLALPQISEDLSMRAVSLTWIATAYLISTAIFQIPFARIADLVGRKKIFIIGIAVFTVCTLLCGFATSGTMLIAMRFMSGIGSAMMFGTNIAIITSLFPQASRGKALGINTAVVYAAIAAGPYFGGLLTHHLGWQSIFFAVAALGVIVLILSVMFLRGEWIEARGERFDLPGALLYGAGLAGIIYGFSNLPATVGFVCLGGGLVALAAFIVYERRQAYPVFNVRLFSGNRTFALSSVAALINYAATMGITFMLSLYLQYVRGLDANQAGVILIAQAVVQSLFSIIAGWLSARIAPSILATAGMTLISIGLAALIFITVSTPVWMLVCVLALFGVGFGIFSSPNTNVIMSSVDKKDYSQASAATGTMRLAGQSFSMGIAGMAISFTVGNEKIVPALYPAFMQSMRITFVIFFCLCLIGIYASTARIKKSL